MAMPVADSVRPLRRSEYDQLIALGAFQDERIELIDGVLVHMSPSGPPHCDATTRLGELLVHLLYGRARIRIQQSFAAGDFSEPEPDLAVVPLGDYSAEHPATAHLIVEVAESSLARDRGRKAKLYAECGVPEYWIVNLQGRTVEVHIDPTPSGYRATSLHAKGAVIHPRAFPELPIPLDSFLK